MNWQDVASVCGRVGEFLLRVFWDPDRNGFPSVDAARNIAFTLVAFLLGWAVSLFGAHKRLKERVITELIGAQRELMARAYPKKWKRNAMREAWMLQPFVERIQFLHEHLRESKGLRRTHLENIDKYQRSVQAFIAKWAAAKHHSDDFHELYATSYWFLRKAVTSLGLKELSRLSGLMPDRPLLPSPSKKGESDEPPPTAKHLALVPAE